MARCAWLLFFLFAILLKNAMGIFGVDLRAVPAVLGETVLLSSSVDCTGERSALVHRLPDDRPVPVAAFIRGVWMPEDPYRGRIEHRSKTTALLVRVNYNDQGAYEFTCDGYVVSGVRLEVAIISNNDLSVSEGDTVQLPCYSFTADEAVESVWWERDGKRVFELDTSTGKTRVDGFEGRVSVSPDWYLLGNLSLTLNRAQLGDQGRYFCYVRRGGEERGEPGAVRLKVTKRTQSQITPPAVLCTTHVVGKIKCAEDWAIAVTFLVTLVIVGPCAALLGWRWNPRRRHGGH